MTVKTTATGNGTETSYEVGFPYLHRDHLRVFVNGVKKTYGTDFSIVTTLQQSSEGGEKDVIKFAAAPTNGHAIKIVRNTPWAVMSPTLKIGHADLKQALYKSQEMKGKAFDELVAHMLQTALLAGTAVSFEAPCDGYVDALRTLVTKAVTTGGALTVEIDGTAVTGLTLTIGDGAIVGAGDRDVPTTALSATTKFYAGSAITITPAAAFATAGELIATLEVTPADL
jgi:hypothetical protein